MTSEPDWNEIGPELLEALEAVCHLADMDRQFEDDVNSLLALRNTLKELCAEKLSPVIAKARALKATPSEPQ